MLLQASTMDSNAIKAPARESASVADWDALLNGDGVASAKVEDESSVKPAPAGEMQVISETIGEVKTVPFLDESAKSEELPLADDRKNAVALLDEFIQENAELFPGEAALAVYNAEMEELQCQLSAIALELDELAERRKELRAEQKEVVKQYRQLRKDGPGKPKPPEPATTVDESGSANTEAAASDSSDKPARVPQPKLDKIIRPITSLNELPTDACRSIWVRLLKPIQGYCHGRTPPNVNYAAKGDEREAFVDREDGSLFITMADPDQDHVWLDSAYLDSQDYEVIYDPMAEQSPTVVEVKACDWRELPIATLTQYKAREKAVEAAEKAKLTTVGEIAAAMEKHKTYWPKECGVRKNYQVELEDAVGLIKGALGVTE